MEENDIQTMSVPQNDFPDESKRQSMVSAIHNSMVSCIATDMARQNQAFSMSQQILQAPHTYSVRQIISGLGTTAEGYSKLQRETLSKDAPLNVLKAQRSMPAIVSFFTAQIQFFSGILWVAFVVCIIIYAATVSSGIEGYEYNIALAVCIAILNVITGILSALQQSKANKQRASIQSLMPLSCIVLEDNQEREIDSKHLLIGDVVCLKAGQRCPADVRIIKQTEMGIDLQQFTGESEPQMRNIDQSAQIDILKAQNMAFCGCGILQGEGHGVVVAVADNTQLGQQRLSITQKRGKVAKTQLQKNVFSLVMIVTLIACVTGLLILILSVSFGLGAISSIVFAIGLIVANVPEGLNLALIVSLQQASDRLKKKDLTLVKNCNDIETFGRIQVICSDKTGTLTKGVMEVTDLWQGENNNWFVSTLLQKSGSFAKLQTLMESQSGMNSSIIHAKVENVQGGVGDDDNEGKNHHNFTVSKIFGNVGTESVPEVDLGGCSGKDVELEQKTQQMQALMANNNGQSFDIQQRQSIDTNLDKKLRFSKINSSCSSLEALRESIESNSMYSRQHRDDENSTQSIQNTIINTVLALNLQAFEKEDGSVHGDPSEKAIFKHLQKSQNILQLKSVNKQLGIIPFNSRDKFQITINSIGDRSFISAHNALSNNLCTSICDPAMQQIKCFNPDSEVVLVTLKGAAEVILSKSRFTIIAKSPYIEDSIAHIKEEICNKASRGERVLGVAYMLLPKSQVQEFLQEGREMNLPDDYIFCGLISMVDQPRDDAYDIIKIFSNAGIKVIMVTGDHPQTAASLARNIGILEDNELDILTDISILKQQEEEQQMVLDDEFRITTRGKDGKTHVLNPKSSNKKFQHALSDILDSLKPRYPTSRIESRSAVMSGEFLSQLTNLELLKFLYDHDEIVFSRLTPAQKKRIVRAYQMLNKQVGALGDGLNDAPALSQADAGAAMNCGSDVAQDAARMVLLDNALSGYSRAVREGRLIFDNLQKCIAYCLSTALPEMLPYFFNIFFGFPHPLSPIAVILIDIVTSIWPSFALSFEEPENTIMEGEARSQHVKLFSGALAFHSYIVSGIYQLASMIFIFMFGVCWRFHVFTGAWPSLSIFASMKNDDFETQRLVSELWKHNSTLKYNAKYATVGSMAQNINRYGQTCGFMAILGTQIAQALICKTRIATAFSSRIYKNWRLIVATAATLIIGILLINLPFLHNFLQTEITNALFWAILIPLGAIMIAHSELRKLIVRSLDKRNKNHSFFGY